MREINELAPYLVSINLHPAAYNFDAEKKCFINKVEDGLKNKGEEMEMIPSYIGVQTDIFPKKSIIIIDAGGTNLRVYGVVFDGTLDKHEIIYEKSYPMPGSKHAISKDAFFEALIDAILPVKDISDTLAFCFSFAAEILPNKDAVIIGMSKEVVVQDLLGTVLGKALNDKLKARGLAEYRVIILNDTVSALISGLGTVQKRSMQSCIGMILGTGFNIAYIEQVDRILKLTEQNLSFKHMVINMEAGGYPIAKRGKIDEKLDRLSAKPGSHLFEKMLSGKYLGTLVYLALEDLVNEGFFSETFRKQFASIEDLGTFELSVFLETPLGESRLGKICETDQDRTVIYEVISAVFSRAAKLLVMAISAILEYTETGDDPIRPAALVVEGTTFYKAKGFKEIFNYYVKHYLESKGQHIDVIRTEHSNVIGSAIAGLME